jgi:hypothetical protein
VAAVTEAEWLNERLGSQLMLWELHTAGKVYRTKSGRRKLRLFACACCRLVWELLPDRRSRVAVEVAEEFADGRATKEALGAARGNARELEYDSYSPDAAGVRPRIAASMAASAAAPQPFSAAFDMTSFPLPLLLAGRSGVEETLCDLVRCIFGNPFRPAPPIDPAWLAWNGGTVPMLAHAIYEQRTFERLPVLADALEDAGCSDPELLGHLRSGAEHARGCWALDLILDKE